MKKYFVLLLCILCFIVGLLTGIGYLNFKSSQKVSDASLVLTQVKDVFKLVNVEAEFSEIFQEKSYTLIDFGPFKKSIIVRVKARVLIGYNLDSSAIKMDSAKRILRIFTSQQPEVISNEMNIDYYDIQQGTFNSFSSEELNMIHDKARDIILRRVEKAEFFERARKRQEEYFKTIYSYCELMNWKLDLVTSQAQPKNTK